MSKKADRKALASKVKALDEDNFQIRLTAQKFLKLAEAKVLRLQELIDNADGYRGHPSWEERSFDEVLKALRFQGSITKTLMKQEEKFHQNIEAASKEIDAAVRRGDLQNGAANDIRQALGLETKA